MDINDEIHQQIIEMCDEDNNGTIDFKEIKNFVSKLIEKESI